jgi:hypothetical protein
MWNAGLLSINGSTVMSAVGSMTPFQFLSTSGGGGISTPGQVLCEHSVPMSR